MTALDSLLAAAGGTVVGTMGTDLYRYTRARIAEIVGRHNTDTAQEAAVLAQLDALNETLIATDSEDRAKLATAMKAPVIRILKPYADPENSHLLQELIDTIESKQSSSQRTTLSQQNVYGNTAWGEIYTAGRDNNIGRGR